MEIHWTAFGVGILAGAALGWYMGKKPVGGGAGVTGSFAAPFQAFMDQNR